MFRRRRRRAEWGGCMPCIAAAFGAGLLLACLFSAKLALFLAAIVLICLGTGLGR